MDFLQLAKSRYSVRHFTNKQVEIDKLEQVLEAGRMAPSAVNFQPWHFIVVNDHQLIDQLHQCYHREWFNTAQCCIVACGNHEQGWKRAADGKDHTNIDVSIAIDHMTLQAAALDLGTCWVCNFDLYKVKTLFNLPDHIEPVALLPIGYPDPEHAQSLRIKKRKPLDEVVSWNKY